VLDSLLFDIKTLDSARHKECTGVPNERILANFKRIVETFPELPIHVRTPIIPGFNDTEQNVRAIAELVAPYPNVDYEILPYHRLGTQKYVFLDREPPMGEASLPDETFRQLQAVVKPG
jgi:pyruvate formate lyase activating enzyme